MAKIRIDNTAKKTIERRAVGPEIDAELMERLGQDDPAFVEWLEELEPKALLERALERTLSAISPPSGATFSIRDGAVVMRAEGLDRKEEVRANATFERIASRWQIELLSIVGDILDFELTLETTSEGGQTYWVLEGEKASSSSVKEYLRIAIDATGGTELRFEHYRSARALEIEEARFRALALRLGLRITIVHHRRSGQDIPEGAVHAHLVKGKKGKP